MKSTLPNHMPKRQQQIGKNKTKQNKKSMCIWSKSEVVSTCIGITEVNGACQAIGVKLWEERKQTENKERQKKKQILQINKNEKRMCRCAATMEAESSAMHALQRDGEKLEKKTRKRENERWRAVWWSQQSKSKDRNSLRSPFYTNLQH